jgi:3-hydroxybutyryl-CoA dehydrogenase
MGVVGVVGAGTIGTGVAQAIAQAGVGVTLVDVDGSALDRARSTISRDCRMSAMFGGPELNAEQVLGRIRFELELDSLAGADLVIENVTEDAAIKLAVYRELDRLCAPSVMFVANTSCIPVTRIASWTRRPDKVIGAHFMNPVPRKRYVETIRGSHTSAHTAERLLVFLNEIGKTPIAVGDALGFVSNRVLMPTINEAAFVVYEGIADAATVDQVFRECFGHPMGPLATANLIGIDTVVNSVNELWAELGDKYRLCPLLRAMADAGETFDIR